MSEVFIPPVLPKCGCRHRRTPVTASSPLHSILSRTTIRAHTNSAQVKTSSIRGAATGTHQERRAPASNVGISKPKRGVVVCTYDEQWHGFNIEVRWIYAPCMVYMHVALVQTSPEKLCLASVPPARAELDVMAMHLEQQKRLGNCSRSLGSTNDPRRCLRRRKSWLPKVELEL